MERGLIYLLAIADVLVGLSLFYRGGGRFGLMTYRTFLDREERQKIQQKMK
ncbi:MAG: hypothetical protein PUK54_07240 [Firmicutes bacterium]|nr:hypothetical protein [Bacillota bacterium]MDY5855666.1 hypothetical protein [Anaerovoracaceae bacterium]